MSIHMKSFSENKIFNYISIHSLKFNDNNGSGMIVYVAAIWT